MNFLTQFRWLLFSIIGGIIDGFAAYELEPSHSRMGSFWVGLIGAVVTAIAGYLGWSPSRSESRG